MGRTHALELDAAGRSVDRTSSIICGLHATLTISASSSHCQIDRDDVPRCCRYACSADRSRRSTMLDTGNAAIPSGMLPFPSRRSHPAMRSGRSHSRSALRLIRLHHDRLPNLEREQDQKPDFDTEPCSDSIEYHALCALIAFRRRVRPRRIHALQRAPDSRATCATPPGSVPRPAICVPPARGRPPR